MNIVYIYRWIKGLSSRKNCCDNKIRYSKQSAEKARLAMQRKCSPKLFDKYWCPWCRKWHIGRSVKNL